MTLQDVINMINKRFEGVSGQLVRSSVNHIVSKMNLKLEGERVSVIAVNNSNKISGEFAGTVGFPAAPGAYDMYICCTTGGGYAAGEIWEYDGDSWNEVSVSVGDVYFAYVALTVATWAVGEVRACTAANTWVANGYLWIDQRLTLKSSTLRVLKVMINDILWENRPYDEIDEENGFLEYYEENRNVLRFNAYYVSQGDVRVISMNGITQITGSSDPDTKIEFPASWESVFMDGVVARVAGYLKDEKDTFGMFHGMYNSGLKAIQEFEANRLPYAYNRASE